eukprot:14367980-Alexandrium_andersonii.AAC.1
MATTWAVAGCHPARWRVSAGRGQDPIRALPLRCRVRGAAAGPSLPRRDHWRERRAGRSRGECRAARLGT